MLDEIRVYTPVQIFLFPQSFVGPENALCMFVVLTDIFNSKHSSLCIAAYLSYIALRPTD
jgi:hypothetical protein